MFESLKSLIARIRSSRNYTTSLEVILNQANPKAPLFERLSWLVDLMQWVRYKSMLVDLGQGQGEAVGQPITRLRFFFSVLERNPEWKKKVAACLRSILVDVRYVDLFSQTGLPEELSFWSEFWHRVVAKAMLARPLTEGGVQLFAALFPDRDDLDWFSKVPAEIVQKSVDLILFERGEGEHFVSLVEDLEEALLILGSQVRSIGMTYPVRRRLENRRVYELPFFRVTKAAEEFVDSVRSGSRDEVMTETVKFRSVLASCLGAFDEVYQHLDEHGVSLKVVYLLESGRAKVRRMIDLIDLLGEEQIDSVKLIAFMCGLIEGMQEKASVWALFQQNTRLISQKIVERNAEIGEHYITQDKAEYKKMFKKAQGGGAYMAITVVLKIGLGFLKLPEFLQGIVYSVNYSFGFVGIQLRGFTLATKQPAMTGPALASKMQKVQQGEPVDLLVDEIVKLIRSQFVGILGNVGVVVPGVLILSFIFYFVIGVHIAGNEVRAEYLLNNSHLLGFSSIYGAFTGFLLWLSSVCAGYVDNWFFLNRMRETIMLNRRLKYVFGSRRIEWVANFLEKNISGLAANISLAFFLGMTPQIMAFLGLYMDVRHVTLAAGNVALGAVYFGLDVFKMGDFWFSLVGLFVIGFMNVAVSFALAFWVALRSRSLRTERRHEVYRAIVARFKANPMSFFLPR